MFKRFSMMALLAMSGVATADDLQCLDVETPPAPVCVSTPYGLAYADTEEEARRAAAALGDAAQKYALHFGRSPSGTLVLSTDLDPLVARDQARAHGLDYAQVWLPIRAKRAMTERAMRQAKVGRTAITRALAGVAEQEAVTLRHELGHAMYAAMYWPDAAGSSLQPGYGTPAPDWLDEAVAILMEPPEAQARHLESFIAAAKQRPRTIPGLDDFLRAEHPVRSAALANALSRGPKSGSGVQMMVADPGAFPALDSFYGQSLLVALFLAETSGDPRILVPISAAITGGDTFDQWLASNGEAHRLPGDLPALQALWDGWLKSQVLRRGRGGKP